jgi:hypothetical protein
MRRALAIIATALATVVVASVASAQGHPHTAGAPVGQELIPAFHGIDRDARRAFGRRFGCVIDGPRRLGFLITSRSQLDAARAIVRQNRAAAFTRIAVIAPRYSEPRMLAVMQAAGGDLGASPDYLYMGKPAQTPGATRCLTLLIQVSSEAELAVAEHVRKFQLRYGTDRVKVQEVPPDQIPPPDQRPEPR